MNSIMADVQEATTQSKTQTTQWKIQDEVRQAAKEWIDKANKTNVDRMHTEMKDITIDTPSSTQPNVLPEDDPIWKAFTSSEISMPLHKLLQLLPRFKDTLASLTTGTNPTSLLVNFAEPGTGPPLKDS